MSTIIRQINHINKPDNLIDHIMYCNDHHHHYHQAITLK